MANRKPPRWQHLTLDPPDAGPITAGDGRTWPAPSDTLAELAGAGWRLVGAARAAARERSRLRRPRA